MGRGGAPLVTQYWGGTRHFFLLILYNFKSIGGNVPPGPPCSAVPGTLKLDQQGFQKFEVSA